MAQVRADRMFRHIQLPNPRAIRILVLEPTIDPSSEIKCSLYFTSLDDPLEFEALSYSWDSQTLSHPILCRQLFAGPDVYFTLNVTYNCLAALKRFRLSDLPRPLWIDSICIDQTNVEERNQQVSLMGELYPSARHVTVWLGEKDEATEQAMKFITNFGDGIINVDKSVEKRKDEVSALLHERLGNIKSTPDAGNVSIPPNMIKVLGLYILQLLQNFRINYNLYSSVLGSIACGLSKKSQHRRLRTSRCTAAMRQCCFYTYTFLCVSR
jgi:Heterokaryon incompatibility protein (HET)